MIEKLRQKLLHALPTLRALGQWLGLAGSYTHLSLIHI